MIREPQAKGFYPRDPQTLRQMAEGMLERAEDKKQGPFRAGMVPHAGYMYSGLAAATFFKNLKPADKLVVLGVDHYGNCSDVCLHTYDSWKTPLGEVKVDQELAAQLQELDPELTCSSQEHSIEVQLPFLQVLDKWEDFTFLPITVPHAPFHRLKKLGRALSELGVPVVASSDLTHYMPKPRCMELDALAIEKITDRDPSGLLSVVEHYDISMCGAHPVSAMLASLPEEAEGQLLVYYTSGDVTGDASNVVGYASIGFK